MSEHVDWFYAQKEIFEKQGCSLHEMNSKYVQCTGVYVVHSSLEFRGNLYLDTIGLYKPLHFKREQSHTKLMNKNLSKILVIPIVIVFSNR